MWRNSQSGRTMIETLAVIAIIGMLGKGILSVIYALYDKYRVSEITTQIKDLQDKIRLRYSAVGDYSELSDASKIPTLIKENVIPVNMRSGDTVVHSFSGNVIFNENEAKLKDDVTGEITKYSITFKDVEAKACFELLNMSWTVNETSDLYSIAAGNKTFTWGAANEQESLPISVSAVADICKSKTDITWIFQ